MRGFTIRVTGVHQFHENDWTADSFLWTSSAFSLSFCCVIFRKRKLLISSNRTKMIPLGPRYLFLSPRQERALFSHVGVIALLSPQRGKWQNFRYGLVTLFLLLRLLPTETSLPMPKMMEDLDIVHQVGLICNNGPCQSQRSNS